MVINPKRAETHMHGECSGSEYLLLCLGSRACSTVKIQLRTIKVLNSYEEEVPSGFVL